MNTFKRHYYQSVFSHSSYCPCQHKIDTFKTRAAISLIHTLILSLAKFSGIVCKTITCWFLSFIWLFWWYFIRVCLGGWVGGSVDRWVGWSVWAWKGEWAVVKSETQSSFFWIPRGNNLYWNRNLQTYNVKLIPVTREVLRHYLVQCFLNSFVNSKTFLCSFLGSFLV